MVDILADMRIDVRGETCPVPLVEVRKAVRKASPGDVIEVKQKSQELPLVLEAVSTGERDVPEYLQVDFDKMNGTYVRVPTFVEVPYPVQMEPNLVVEFYSSG